MTKDDQRRINAFGRLNTRKLDVQAELAGKKVRACTGVSGLLRPAVRRKSH